MMVTSAECPDVCSNYEVGVRQGVEDVFGRMRTTSLNHNLLYTIDSIAAASFVPTIVCSWHTYMACGCARGCTWLTFAQAGDEAVSYLSMIATKD